MTEVILEILVEPQSTSVPIYRYVPTPPGGTIGQALLKRTDVDYDYEWGDVSGGGSSNPFIVNKTAGETISGHRVVMLGNAGTVLLADPRTYARTGPVYGLSLGAATVSQPITIQTQGTVTEPSWGWVEGDVWLGLDGQLTQVLPTTDFLVRVGVSITSNTILLGFEIVGKLS